MNVPSERCSSAGSKERIDHRKAIAENVGERHRDEVLAAFGVCAVGRLAPIFDDASLDMAVLNHHRIVEHSHVCHAAMVMAGVEIGAEDRILLRGRNGAALFANKVGVARKHATKPAGGAKFIGDDPDGHAGVAKVTGRPVRNRLAAPEPAMGEEVVEFSRAVANQMGKNLALLQAREIGAGGRRREVGIAAYCASAASRRVWSSPLGVEIDWSKFRSIISRRQLKSR